MAIPSLFCWVAFIKHYLSSFVTNLMELYITHTCIAIQRLTDVATNIITTQQCYNEVQRASCSYYQLTRVIQSFRLGGSVGTVVTVFLNPVAKSHVLKAPSTNDVSIA